MTGLSPDPEKAARQLANLRPWPPAEKGNQRARKTGLRSKKRVGVDKIRAELYAELASASPVKEDGALPPADSHAVELLARELARIREADAYLAEHGVLDADGVPRPAVELLERAGRNAIELLDRLGLNPRSRAVLGLDLKRAEAFDLAAHWAAEDVKARRNG